MNRKLLKIGIGAWIISAMGAWGAPTAKQALSVLEAQRGSAYAAEILHVVGVGGTDQPLVWRVIVKDPDAPGAIRDFAIEGNRVVADQVVPPAYHGRIPQVPVHGDSVKVNSDAVFQIANDLARSATVKFDSLDYEIRGDNPATGALWLVRLNSRQRVMVGELMIRASDGAVLQQRWPEMGTEARIEPLPTAPEPQFAEPQFAEQEFAEQQTEEGYTHPATFGGKVGKSVDVGLASVKKFFRYAVKNAENPKRARSPIGSKGQGAKVGRSGGAAVRSSTAAGARAPDLGGSYY